MKSYNPWWKSNRSLISGVVSRRDWRLASQGTKIMAASCIIIADISEDALAKLCVLVF
jgi:hypothetical protein